VFFPPLHLDETVWPSGTTVECHSQHRNALEVWRQSENSLHSTACWAVECRDDDDRQRSRAARRHAVDRDAHLAGFIGQVVLDAGAREDHDADRHAVEHLVVALEGCGLGVFGPVRLEGDLRHFAVGGPGCRDALGALGRSTMQQHHVGMLGVDLIETIPDHPVIGGVAAREGNLRPRGHQALGLCTFLGGDEVSAVDHRGGQVAMAGARA